MKIEGEMAPMDPAAARVLVQVQRDHGQRVRDLLREFIDIERRLEWLNQHEPLEVSPTMADEEISAAVAADRNIAERRALVARKEAIFEVLPPSAVAAYRYPDTPMLVLR